MPKQIKQFLFAVILLSSGHHRADAWFNNWRTPTKPKTTSHTTTQEPTKANKKPITPPPPPKSQFPEMPEVPDAVSDALDDLNPITPGLWNSMTSAALSVASSFAPKSMKENSDRSARVRINRLPPTSFRVDLSDVPLVGKALSGTYAKVKDDSGKVKTPSVVISSPRDKFGAVQDAADKGNLGFNLDGILSSNLDIQLEANQPGEAPVTLESPLIPRWPFAQRKSNWYRVSNCGNGETYYFNSKTGETQIKEPKDFFGS